MDDSTLPLLGILIFIIIIGVNVVFYGFGAAIQNINLKLLAQNAQEGDKTSLKLIKIKENPGHFVNTIQIAITLTDIIVGVYQVMWFGEIIFSYLLSLSDYKYDLLLHILSYLVVLLIFVYFIVSFGVFAPKIIASKYPEKWAYKLVTFISLIESLLKPITFLTERSSRLIVRLWGIDSSLLQEDVTEEEIISMVDEGQEQGILLESEAKMIHNIFELNNTEAKDIMTHRKSIISINGNMTLDEAFLFMLKMSNSRYPVFDENPDDILGIVHFRDVAVFHKNKTKRELMIKELPQLIRAAEFVPETQNVNTILKTMQTKKQHLVIVVDEYGQTAGLVAMEDILEEIVGNILDEYDEDEMYISELDENSYIILGITSLKDIEEFLDIDFGDLEYDTLNGYIINKINKIPSEDEKIEFDVENYNFKVLEVENKTIKRVQVVSCQENETVVE